MKLKTSEIENLRNYIKIMEAFLNGKDVQCRYHTGNLWVDCVSPAFNFGINEYRIKPEVKELFYCIYKTSFGHFYSTNPVDKKQYQKFVEDIISTDGVIVEERKITVTSEYE